MSLRVSRTLVWTLRLHVTCPFLSLGGTKTCWKPLLLCSLRKNLSCLSLLLFWYLLWSSPSCCTEWGEEGSCNKTGRISLYMCPHWWMARSAWLRSSFSYLGVCSGTFWILLVFLVKSRINLAYAFPFCPSWPCTSMEAEGVKKHNLIIFYSFIYF